MREQGGAGDRQSRRKVRWSAMLKGAFLDHLAATCDIAQSAARIGVPPLAIYHLRRRDAAFAEAWATALLAGYEMLETQLVGLALSGRGRVDGAATAAGAGPVDIDLAIRLLTMHRAATSSGATRGLVKRRRATAEETERTILQKLAQIERRAKRAA